MNQRIRLGFLGAGNMGAAIMKGVSAASVPCSLYAFDMDEEKLEQLLPLGITACESAQALCNSCDYLLLAVKPQQLDALLSQITLRPEQVVISICAGVSADFIQQRTLPDAKVILVMPNTPLMLGEGASALARCEGVSDDEFAFAMQIFSSCGLAEEIPADRMKEIIAVNGSSPAFIYLFAKGFTDYAASVGIDADAALRLFAQSLIGSAKMLTDSGNTVEELIRMVSSPGGTTLAGLDAYYEGGLSQLTEDACRRCTKRAYELGA